MECAVAGCFADLVDTIDYLAEEADNISLKKSAVVDDVEHSCAVVAGMDKCSDIIEAFETFIGDEKFVSVDVGCELIDHLGGKCLVKFCLFTSFVAEAGDEEENLIFVQFTPEFGR